MQQVQPLNDKCSVFHHVQFPITSKLICNIPTKPAHLMKFSTQTHIQISKKRNPIDTGHAVLYRERY
jgi:hypothetical protein